MSETTPTFTDDDTARSWLQRIDLDNWEIFYSQFWQELEKELSLLRREGTRNPISAFYFFLGDILKKELDQKTRTLVESLMTEIAQRFLSEYTRNAVDRLLKGEIIIADTETT